MGLKRERGGREAPRPSLRREGDFTMGGEGGGEDRGGPGVSRVVRVGPGGAGGLWVGGG